MSTIIVGIGNPILGDDGVGIHVLKELQGRDLPDDITLEEAFTGGMNLLDLIIGHERAVLIDALDHPDRPIGTVLELSIGDISSSHSTNPHDTSFPEALEVAVRMGQEDIPPEIHLVGIVIRQQLDFSVELSDPVKKAVDIAADKVLRILGLNNKE